MMWFACDLDHTLCDSSWRDGMFGTPDNPNSSWDVYNEAADHDLPVPEVRALVQTLVASGVWQGIAWTARPEKWRSLTLGWLARWECPLEELLMRPTNDFRRAPEVKLDMLRRRPGGLAQIEFVIEDRLDVVEACRSAGITALHIHPKRIPTT